MGAENYKIINIRILRIALFFLLMSACENENADYPREYYFDSYKTGKVRVFTNSGEIDNEQLSATFINQWPEYFYKNDSFEIADFDLKEKISFISENQLIVDGEDEIIKLGLKRRNNLIYIESVDTSYSNKDIVNMKDNRFLFSPLTQTNVIENGYGGFPPVQNFSYGYFSCLYAMENGDEIKFPFVSFLEKNCTSDTSGSIFGGCYNMNAVSNINNLFDENYLKRITNNSPVNLLFERRDTVVIQENFIVFRRKSN